MPDHPAAAAFRRILDWLREHAPAAVAELGPPATDEQLAELERAINTPAVKGLTAEMIVDDGDPPGDPDPAGRSFGRPVPDDLAAVLRVCDGAGFHAVLPVSGGMYGEAVLTFASVAEILADYRTQRDLTAIGEFADCEPEDTAPGVRETWWDEGWLPFGGDGGGNLLCLDYHPAPGGTPGQVLTHDHETGEHALEASSLTAFLEAGAAALEAGRFVWDEDEGQLMPREDEEPRP